MSVSTPKYIDSPTGESEPCACFIIDDVRESFTLFDVCMVGEQYTLSFWVKSEAASRVKFNDFTFTTTTSWVKHDETFDATSKDIVVSFGAVGTYYLYHTQIETGHVATEWTAAPEDMEADIADARDKADGAQQTADDAVNKVGIAEASIQLLSDTIQSLVRDETGASLMTQEGDRWIFNMGKYDKDLSTVSNNLDILSKNFGDTENAIDILNDAVRDLGVMTEYVTIGTFNNAPCIELGKIGSPFKVRITNTDIQFLDGDSTPAYLSNQKLMIESAEVTHELQFGGFAWTMRSNGNMGIIWKGVDT